MHALREIIGALAFPLRDALLLLVAGLALGRLGLTNARRWLFGGALLLGYLGATPLAGRALLAPLENEYPALDQTRPLPAVGYVVVLGSGYDPRGHDPITAAFDPDGLARIVEGVRLVRQLGGARLVLSGGAPPGRVPPARGYASLADDLGVRADSIMVSDRSLDTAEEARAVARLLGRAPFLLVTSAYHMPRAMRLMRLAGANPIAAPTMQRADAGARRWWDRLLPSSGGLDETQRALHEYLGLVAVSAGLG